MSHNVRVPRTDYLGIEQVAAALGITIDSARTYHTRAQRNRREGTPKPGDLPPPDVVFGRSPAWLPSTIDRHLNTRPGQGRKETRVEQVRREVAQLEQQIAALTERLDAARERQRIAEAAANTD